MPPYAFQMISLLIFVINEILPYYTITFCMIITIDPICVKVRNISLSNIQSSLTRIDILNKSKVQILQLHVSN